MDLFQQSWRSRWDLLILLEVFSRSVFTKTKTDPINDSDVASLLTDSPPY